MEIFLSILLFDNLFAFNYFLICFFNLIYFILSIILPYMKEKYYITLR